MTVTRTSFSKSLLEQPQLVTPRLFEEVASYLDGENSHIYEKLLQQGGTEDKSEFADLVQENIGVLNIEGTLVNKKPTGWAAMCMSMTSYEALTEQAQYLAEQPQVDTILMNVSSGGGEAFNCFLAARNIKRILTDKKIVAYVDGMSASAAYALSVIADEIISHPDSETGSIGVVIRLLDQSKALEDAGIKPIYITAGGNKVPFEEDGSFKESHIAKLKDGVDELYGEFVEHVVTMRGLDKQTVLGTNAETFRASKAQSIGLIDKVMSYEEFANYLADITGPNSGNTTVELSTEENTTVALSTEHLTKEEEEMAVDAETQAKLDKLADMEAELAAYKAKDAANQLAEFTALVADTEFSNKEGIVAGLVQGGETAELLSGMVADYKAAVSMLNEDHAEKLTKVREEAEAEVESVKTEMTKVKEEADLIKEEFSKPEGLDGNNATIQDDIEDEDKSSKLAAFLKENGETLIKK